MEIKVNTGPQTLTMPGRDVDHERVCAIVYGLTPQQSIFVSWMARGAIADTKQTAEYLGIKTMPKIIVAQSRRRLRTFELDIQSKWGTGYWMADDHRKIVNDSIAKFSEGR